MKVDTAHPCNRNKFQALSLLPSTKTQPFHLQLLAFLRLVKTNNTPAINVNYVTLDGECKSAAPNNVLANWRNRT